MVGQLPYGKDVSSALVEDVKPTRSRRRKADMPENQFPFLDTLAKAA